jgi:transcriptional antiterminator
MNEKELKDRRAFYIQNRLSAVDNKPTEIKRISNELYISERTVRRDANKNIDTMAIK